MNRFILIEILIRNDIFKCSKEKDNNKYDQLIIEILEMFDKEINLK